VTITDPCFIGHQGHQTGDVLLDVVNTIGTSVPGARVAATVFVPRYKPATLAAKLGALDTTALWVVADPETHKLDDPYEDRGKCRDDYAYLQESDPIVNARRFVRNVLAAQVDADRDVLVSPWLLHGAVPNNDNLDATLRFAHIARTHPLVGDSELMLGFAVMEGIARHSAARDHFLDEVTDLDPATLYLRVCLGPTVSWTQYRDYDVLAGLGVMVASLVENDFPVVLPLSGLVGWLMLAFGAHAFGAGVSNKLHSFTLPTSGFGQPLEWYFYEPLLGFVLRTEVPALNAALGLADCPCRYCARLPLAGPGAWDGNVAGQHFLTTCAKLMHEATSAPDPRAAVAARLAAASASADQVQRSGVVLDARSEPRHLEVWTRVVP
jgi:hypothetical protein